MSEDHTVKLTVIDQIANGENLQMMKALLPYMGQGNQPMMAIYIKAMEISNILSFYEDPQEVQACSLGQPPSSTTEMLQDIRDYCSGPEQAMIDQCLSMMQMLDLYSTFQDSAGDGQGMSGGGMDDMLKNLLSPEQQSMFDSYQSMFDSP